MRQADGVEAAAERLQAHKLQLRVLCDQARQTHEALARLPGKGVARRLGTSCGAGLGVKGVFQAQRRKHGEADVDEHAVDAVEQGRVGVVGAASQHGSPSARVPRPGKRPLVGAPHGVLEVPLGGEPVGQRLDEFVLAHGRHVGARCQAVQAGEQRRTVKVAVAEAGRLHDGELGRCQLAGAVAQKGHAVGQRRRIQAGHGTAIAACVPRHEHGGHALAREVVQAHVGQLGGKAHAFGGDGADALACRAGRFRTPVVSHAEGESQRGEQGVPERALLVGGQHPGQANAGAAPLPARQDVAETREQLLLECDRVRRAALRRLRCPRRRHV